MPGGVFVPSDCPLWVVDLNWVLISLWAVFPEPVRLPERPGRGSPSPRRVEPLPSIDHETLGRSYGSSMIFLSRFHQL